MSDTRKRFRTPTEYTIARDASSGLHALSLRGLELARNRSHSHLMTLATQRHGVPRDAWVFELQCKQCEAWRPQRANGHIPRCVCKRAPEVTP